MKKNLIIGGFSDYTWEQIAPWALSINRCGFVGDKVMVVFKASYDTIMRLFDHGFQVIVFNRDEEKREVFYESPRRVYVERFLQIYYYLAKTAQDYDYVITTDVRDVVFQSDPVAWLRRNLGDKKMVMCGEGIRIKDEPWGRQNFLETFGPEILALHEQNEVFNVGTLAGTADSMKDLMLAIFTAAVNRPIPIVDQAVLNVLIQSQPYKDIIKFVGQEDDWACQAGVMADPTKIDGFRPHLLAREPVFDEGVVKNAAGAAFPLVHQYDRVPQWKQFFMDRFK